MRLYKESKKMLAQRELSIDLTRHFMALFANANRANNQPAFQAEDFLWRLSYDKKPQTEEQQPLSFKEAKALLGSKIRKENGGQ